MVNTRKYVLYHVFFISNKSLYIKETQQYTSENPKNLYCVWESIRCGRSDSLFPRVIHDVARCRELLLDVLPAVPNAAVIPVVVDCVHAGIVSAPRAMIMINTMVLSAPPTPAAATAFLVWLLHHTSMVC